MCVGENMYSDILSPTTCKGNCFTQNAVLEAWIKSTEIEHGSKMLCVSFYLALKEPFQLLLSLKYNQAIS